MPIYDENGELTYYNRLAAETGNIYAYPNYVRAAKEIINENTVTNVLTNGFIQVSPIEGLTLKSTINAEIRNEDYFWFNPSTASAGINQSIPTVAVSIRQGVRDFSWLSENLATYTRSFNDHNFDLLVGYTNQHFRRE